MRPDSLTDFLAVAWFGWWGDHNGHMVETKLKNWERVWALEYVRNGGNATKAYQVARPESSLGTCQTEGSRCHRTPHIMAEVERLRAEMVQSKFLSSDERRQFLADTVRANPQTVMSEKPHLAQAVTVTRRILDTGEVEEKVQIKLADKLKALALDAQMSGELAPVQGGNASPIASALDALMGLAGPSPAPAPLALPPSQAEDDEDLL